MINSYRDLEVWQRARKLVKLVYETTYKLPSEEKFGLSSQMRRAVVSVCANIAEGWGRHYPSEFIQFVRIANGSLTELETHLILCMDLGYLSQPGADPMVNEVQILSRQLLALERSLTIRSAGERHQPPRTKAELPVASR